MKPRFICRKGVWYCNGGESWGTGYTVMDAWRSWVKDWTSWSRK